MCVKFWKLLFQTILTDDFKATGCNLEDDNVQGKYTTRLNLFYAIQKTASNTIQGFVNIIVFF